MGGQADGERAAALARVAAYEERLRRTPLTALLRAVAPTRPFAAAYRRVGPRLDRFLIRRSGGRVASRLYGLPVLLLTTTGAKSGQPRTTPLVYVRDGDDFVVTGTNFGQSAHPAWTGNLLAHPAATAEIGPERLAVTAELADQASWDRLWPRLLEIYPGYADYLRRRGQQPRMFLLHPGGAE